MNIDEQVEVELFWGETPSIEKILNFNSRKMFDKEKQMKDDLWEIIKYEVESYCGEMIYLFLTKPEEKEEFFDDCC